MKIGFLQFAVLLLSPMAFGGDIDTTALSTPRVHLHATLSFVQEYPSAELALASGVPHAFAAPSMLPFSAASVEPLRIFPNLGRSDYSEPIRMLEASISVSTPALSGASVSSGSVIDGIQVAATRQAQGLRVSAEERSPNSDGISSGTPTTFRSAIDYERSRAIVRLEKKDEVEEKNKSQMCRIL